MKLWLVPALLALCPASAVRAAALDPAVGLRAVDAARDLLNAAHGIGEGLMRTLDDRGVAVEVHQYSKDLSRLEYRQEGGQLRPIVVFSALIAGAPTRYAALLMAENGARVKLAEWPDCAEKDYMIRSLTARAWLEAGGDRSKLPVIDGVRDEKRGQSLKSWSADGLDSFVRAEAAKGRPTLASLIADRRKSLQSAVCEYDERGLLKEIDGLEAFRKEAARSSRDEVGPQRANGSASDGSNTGPSRRP